MRLSNLWSPKAQRGDPQREYQVSRRSLLAAQQIARLGSWEWDAATDVLECSAELARIYGIGEEPMRMTLADLRTYIHPDDMQRMMPQILALREGRVPSIEVEHRIVRADGTEAWTRAFAHSTLDADGRVTHLDGASLDITEQKRAELDTALKDAAMDASLMPITISDRDGRYRYVNRAFALMAGEPVEKLVGAAAASFVPDPELAARIHQSLLETGKWSGDVHSHDANGIPRDVHIIANVLPGMENGGPLVVTSYTDVTEQKRALRELAAREEQLRQIQELARMGTGRFDAATRTYSMPPETRRLLGLGDDYAVCSGAKALGLAHPDDRDMLARGGRDLLAGRVDKQQCTYRFLSPTRGQLRVQIIRYPRHDEAGKVTGFIGILQDVTELKEAEDARRASDARVQSYLDIAGGVVLALDRLGRVELLNRHGRELLGVGDADVTGRDWFELAVPADIHARDRARLAEALEHDREGYLREETEVVNRSGERRMIDWIYRAVRDADGNSTGLLASGWDVTDLRRTEAQLRQAQKMEAVGQLTGGIAHDFNNLLTVILGNAEELMDALQGDPRLRRMAGMVREGANRAAELTHRLLAFSRKQALTPRTVDVNQLLSGLESLMTRTLGGGIELEFVRGATLWKAVVDVGQLENAILNLAINARDAMPRGGRLTIETQNTRLDEEYAGHHLEVRPGQYVAIAVSDTGTGMPAEVLEKAFEPFFTTKGVGKGSGLGLSMVYGFVKQSGGHVKIYSEPGEGTTVKLYLPRAPKDAEAEAPVSRAAEALPTGTERLALVEDDPLVRPYMESVLRSLGYAVEAFEDGPALLRAIDGGLAFDLLLSDVVLPGGMNGRVLAGEVGRRRPGMKVIFLSGYTENAIVHHGRLDDGVHLLHKPFRKADLARKVRTVLDSR